MRHDIQALEILPPVIQFCESPTETYERTVTVTNRSVSLLKVSVVSPASQHFALTPLFQVKDNVTLLAPGLSIQLQLNCSAVSRGQPKTEDSFSFVCEEVHTTFKVPILFTKPSVKIEVADKLDFGTVLSKSFPVGFAQSWTRIVPIKNVSTVPVAVRIFRCQPPFSIGESSFVLGAMGSKDDIRDLKVVFKPTQTSNFQADLFLELSPWNNGYDRAQTARVSFEPSEKQYKTMRISANVIDKQLQILDSNDSSLTEVNFRNILAEIGTESVPLKICNTGPFYVPWNAEMMCLKGAESSFTLHPKSGVVVPNSSETVWISFDNPTLGVIEAECRFRVDPIYCGLNDKEIAIPIHAVVSPVKVKITPHYLKFPETSTAQESTSTFMLKNLDEGLSVKFNIGKLAHFRAHPASGNIGPNQEQIVTVAFAPNQLGNFRSKLEISIGVVKSSTSELQKIHVLSIDLHAIVSSGTDMHTMNHRSVKTAVYDKYIDELRLERYRKQVGPRLNAMADSSILELIDVKKSTIQTVAELKHLDRVNGLLPPEMELPPVGAHVKHHEKLPTTSHTYTYSENPKLSVQANHNKLEQLLKFDLQYSSPVSKSVEKAQRGKPSFSANNLFYSLTVLDFGTMSNHCHRTLQLRVLNLNKGQKPATIKAWQTTQASLKVKMNVQISPPSITLGFETVKSFDITLRCDSTEQQSQILDIASAIVISVDGRLEFEIPVVGKLSPIELKIQNLTDNNLHIEADANLSPPVGEGTIELYNPSECPVAYEFDRVREKEKKSVASSDMNTGVFKVDNAAGVIPGKSSKTTVVRYTPGLANSLSESFVLKVFDPFYGDKPDVICMTQVIEVCGEIQPTKIMPLGTKRKTKTIGTQILGCLPLTSEPFSKIFSSGHPFYPEHIIKFKNVSKNPAAFSMQNTNPDSQVLYSPLNAVIPPGENIEIKYSVAPSRECNISDSLSIHLYGGQQSISIPFQYSCKAAKFVMIRSACVLDFPTVISSSDHGNFVLFNVGEVIGSLCIDLSKYPEFSIQPDDSTLTPVQLEQFQESVQAHGLALSDRTDLNIPTVVRRPFLHEFECVKRGNENVYVIDVAAKQSARLSLMFKPMRANTFDFELPILFADKSQSLHVKVKCRSLVSPLKLSTTQVCFKNKIIRPKDSTNRSEVVVRQTIDIENFGDEEVTWWLDLEALMSQSTGELATPVTPSASLRRQSVSSFAGVRRKTLSSASMTQDAFRFETWSGTLAPNTSSKIAVVFQPAALGVYETSIPFYMDVLGSRNPAWKIGLKGTATAPSLGLDPPQIFLPLIPNGEDTTALFHIYNYGLERVEVSYTVQNDLLQLLSVDPRAVKRITAKQTKVNPKKMGMMEFFFPEGKLLKNEGEAIPVVLHFKAPAYPVSFTTRVEFAVDRLEASFNSQVADKKKIYLIVRGGSDYDLLNVWSMRDSSNNKSAIGQLGAHSKTMGTIEYLKASKSIKDEYQKKKLPASSLPRLLRVSPLGFALGADSQSSQACEKTLSVLNRWFFTPLGLSKYVSHQFPREFIADNMLVAIQTVWARIRGKKLHMTETRDQLKAMELIIAQMQAEGCPMFSIQPHFLGDRKSMEHRVSARLEKDRDVGYTPAFYDIYETFFNTSVEHSQQILKESWVFILSQICRMSLFDHFDALKDGDSDLESFLLRWFEERHRELTGNAVALRFLEDLQADHVLDFLQGIPAVSASVLTDEFSKNQSSEDLLCASLTNIFAGFFAPTTTGRPVTGAQSHVIQFQDINWKHSKDVLMTLYFLYQVYPQLTSPSVVKLSKYNEASVETYNPLKDAVIFYPQFTDTTISIFFDDKELTMAEHGSFSIPGKGTISFRIRAKPSDKKRYFRLHSQRISLFQAKILTFVVDPK